MDVLLPPKWCDAGLLEEGDADLAEFSKLLQTSEYMMALDTARTKPDGRVEEEAVGAYLPVYAIIKVSDSTMSRSLALRVFKNFLQATLLKPGEKGETHVSMAGGKIRIPDPPTTTRLSGSAGMTLHLSEDVFLRLYSYAYLEGFRMHWVEQRTPVFRLFMDFDFKQPEGILACNIERVAYIVNRTVKTFYPSGTNCRLVCAATMYKVEQCTGCPCSCTKDRDACLLCHGSGCTGKRNFDALIPCDKCKGSFPVKRKTGVHILWPELFVTSEQVWEIRESVIADLAKTFGPRGGPMNVWRDVVDLAVYKACTGLRMMGSRKTDTCPLCKGKKGAEVCTQCGNRGKIDAGRPYAPLFATDSNGRRDKTIENVYRSNYYQLLKDTKIRYTGESTPGFCIPAGAPTYATSNQTKALSLNKHGREKIPVVARMVPADAPEHETMQAFFRETQPAHYKDVVVDSVKRVKDREFIVHVTGTNCRFCQNVGRNHKSNRIYFLVTPKGVVQRCHDASDVLDSDMKYGLCRDYASNALAIPPALLGILFPDATTKDVVIGPHVPDAKERTLLACCNKLYRDIYSCAYTSTPFFSGISSGEKFVEVEGVLLSRMGALPNMFTRFVADAVGQYDAVLDYEAERHVQTAEELRASQLPKREALKRSILGIARTILSTVFADEEAALPKLKRIATPGDPWEGDFRALNVVQVERVEAALRFV